MGADRCSESEAGATKVFDAEGALIDDKVRSLLSDFMAGFAEFVASGPPGS